MARKQAGSSGQIRVGVGGWIYAPWRGVFYPEGLTQAKELAYAGSKLTAIEINATYYGSQKPETFAKWHDETPADFVFALKGPRFTTNRRVLVLQTGKWGMQSRATESPHEALRWLEAGEVFDLAILDMQMPGMDGIETAKAIRALPISPFPHMVMVTAYGREEVLKEAALAGLEDVLIKPVSASTFSAKRGSVASSGASISATMSLSWVPVS